MQTTVEETGKHTVKLTVEVPPEEFKPDLDRAYRHVAQEVKIPGFRKGKIPKQILDVQVGKAAVYEHFLRDHLPEYYLRAIREHELAPIADPDIDLAGRSTRPALWCSPRRSRFARGWSSRTTRA